MNIQKPSRELAVGESVTWTFELYFRNVFVYFIPMLAASLVTGIFGALLTAYGIGIPQLPTGALPAEVWNWFATYILGLLVAAITLGIVTWVIYTFATGIVVKCASDAIEKGSVSLQSALSFTVGRLLSLLAGVFIITLLIGVGLVALVIPGIILAIIFSLVVPLIVIGNVGAFDSLGRSIRLVSGRWLKTFLFFLIILVIVVIISAIASAIAAPLSVFGWFVGVFVSGIISAVISAFVAPILPIAMTVHYYSMLAKEQAAMPPPPPPT